MNITQLDYVIAVGKKRNFHQAAKSCFVTQPTLSAMIQKMEDEIGVEIFDRTKKPIEPTQIGKKIIVQAQKTIDQFKKIQEIASDHQGKVDGTLKVGVIPTIASYLIPLFLKSFHEKFPEVNIQIQEMTTENCLSHLEQDYIDVAILATEESSKLYQQAFLYKEELVLYTHELTDTGGEFLVSDLNAKSIWLLEEGHCLRDGVLDICNMRKNAEDLPQNLNIRVGNLELLKNLVREYYGYTLLPYLSILGMSSHEKKRIKKLITPTPQRSVNLTARKNNARTKVIQFLKEEIVANLPKVEGISLKE